ncbi:MAG: hypothetical protein ASARMPRED_007341 [Alectoria sarmentosa]|nr:MAG: hypothetical protein ASARMPRED_007341 [Alectoria sarmentosa]
MMSVAILLGLGLAAIAQAQDQCLAVADSIPLCAVSAIGSAAASVGCNPTDFSCQCVPSNSMAINTAALSSVLKDCGAVTGLAVEAAGSSVCACVASATSAKASTTSSSRSISVSSTSSTSTKTAVVAGSAEPATTPAPSLPTTSTTASVSPSVGTGSGSTTSSSAAQSTGAVVLAAASIGGCLGAFIAIMAAL